MDPGAYVARCTEATYEWTRRFKKWRAILALEPLNYYGRPYTGRLCKFLGLGSDRDHPYAGPQSNFRRLLVEVNGGQPTQAHLEMDIFIGVLYDIDIETVTLDPDEEKRAPEHWYSVVRAIHPCKNQTPPTLQPANPEPLNSSTRETQSTHSTDQHSNTVNIPLAKQQERKRDVRTKARSRSEKATGLGGLQIDQKHDYPVGGTRNVLQSPRATQQKPSERRLRLRTGE